MRIEPETTTLTYSIVRDSPVEVRPVVVMWEVSIDSLQQQVRKIWVDSWEVRIFLWGGHVPPHAIVLYRFPPWGLSISVPSLLPPLLVIFCRRRHPAISGLVALLLVFNPSPGGGGICGFSLLFPHSLLLLYLRLSCPSSLCSTPPWLLRKTPTLFRSVGVLRTPFVRGLIQEMGGSPQDLSSPPTIARQSQQEDGERGVGREGAIIKEGAPPPLGGRGTP